MVVLAGPKNGSICLIHNLLSGGAKARTIAPQPLNIYLGMQVCYQGQTASTLPSQPSHLPPWGGGGGAIARRKRQEEKERGMQRRCNFFMFLSACIFPSRPGQRRPTKAEETFGQQWNFSFFFSASNLNDQGKLSPPALFVCLCVCLLKIHISLSFFFFNLLTSLHKSWPKIPTCR